MANETAVAVNEKAVNKWQTSLLPLMTKTLISLAIFFFIISMIQLYFLQTNILNNPKINVGESLSGLGLDSDLSHKAILENVRMKTLVALEVGSLQNQYYQANSLLMSRVWITYIGFVTGMIMAVVGCVFILGKLSTNISSVSAQLASNSLSINSASPGLIIAFLGTCLMISALFVNHTISSHYAATYIHDLDNNAVHTKSDTMPRLQLDTSVLKTLK